MINRITKHFDPALNPYELKKVLTREFEAAKIPSSAFNEVVVIHRNLLFTLIPKALFQADQLANYLKFNTKMMSSDELVHEKIEGLDTINAYIPFTNINNYVYELFGEFEFKHSGTVLLETLRQLHSGQHTTTVYLHAYENQMDLAVFEQNKLRFYNSFLYSCKEDFMYYLLFSLEQLELDPQSVKVRLFGDIEAGDPYYELCEEYIENIAILVPDTHLYTDAEEQNSFDFTLINAL